MSGERELRTRTAPVAEGTIAPANELLLYQVAAPAEVAQAWSLTEAILAQFQTEVRANGAELTLFYVPAVAAASAESWRQTQQLYGMAEGEWDIALVERRLAAACARLGISLISPTEALRTRMAAGESSTSPPTATGTPPATAPPRRSSARTCPSATYFS